MKSYISRRDLVLKSLNSLILLNVPGLSNVLETHLMKTTNKMTPESFLRNNSSVLYTTLISDRKINFQETPLINHVQCSQIEDHFLKKNKMISQSFEYSVGRLYTKRVFSSSQERTNWIISFVKNNIFQTDLISYNLKIVTPEGWVKYSDLEKYVNSLT